MLVDELHVITELLLPSQADLHGDRVVADAQTQTLMLEVTSTQASPACPRWATAGSRVHSRYTRTLADLPWAEVAVQVHLHVRKCLGPIVPGVGSYASTKYALNALTLTARLELAPANIRVGLMLPGITATDFHRTAVGIGPERSERYRSMPADRPEHVAAKILEAVEGEAAEVFADSIRPLG